ncbi:hypothetical protein L1085_007460 [Streptomyces sp. MSC1_001]|uniref:hypothetical protein n=1 Tax=Streptomyces sp. MSC1_001 TaxID=2909263 RepID=UPI0020305F88|nr:hypothetical protein [Streptomyces sp. MSC1_001]
MPKRTGSITRTLSRLLTTAFVAVTLTGCGMLELARDCEGTDARVEEVAALDIFDSRPDGATVAKGFEKVDAGCWADSGDVVVYAERTYAFPGTRADVAAHYRTVALRHGWSPDPETPPAELWFVNETMSLHIAFLIPELPTGDAHGSSPDATADAGYSISVTSYVDSALAAERQGSSPA